METIGKPGIQKRKASDYRLLVRRSLYAILLLGVLSFLVATFSTCYHLTHPVPKIIDRNPGQYGLFYEDINFASDLDGLKLAGWWIPAQVEDKISQSPKTVIFSHGYAGTRLFLDEHALVLARALATQGYNVLMFDFRNSGQSGKAITSVGYFEQYDLLAAIRYCQEKKQSEYIALFGWSMGASTAIITAAKSPAVKAVIADSPFDNLKEYLETNLHIWSGLPAVPFNPIILSTLSYVYKVDLREVAPRESAAKLNNCSLLIIHAVGDTSIPYQNSVQIYQSVPDKSRAELWLTENSGHIQSYVAYKDDYEQRILNFLANAMSVAD